MHYVLGVDNELYMLISGDEKSLKSCLKLIIRISSQFIYQSVPDRRASNSETPTAGCAYATSRVQSKLTTSGGSQMLSTDNFKRLLHSSYAGMIGLRCLVLEASVDSRSELIQNPLRNVQPMQISMQ